MQFIHGLHVYIEISFISYNFFKTHRNAIFQRNKVINYLIPQSDIDNLYVEAHRLARARAMATILHLAPSHTPT